MRARTERWSSEPVDPEVVWLGDSITRGWKNGGWRVWRESFAERPALNLGVPGDRAADLARRIDRGLLVGLAPSVVVLNIGTNDLGALSARALSDRILGVCGRVQASVPSAYLLVLGIFPRGRRAEPELQRAADQVNARLAQRVGGGRAEFVDLTSAFIDERGRVPDEVMPDGLHLSSVGYARWARAIQPRLRCALDARRFGQRAYPL